MSEHRFLGEFELMILLAILRLENATYGVPLARELSDLRGRDVSLGSVYAALDRLELKGLVKSTLGESTPERGGRAKRFFTVTADGVRSLRETRRVLSDLWKTLPRVKGEMA
jgi:PadR family transcriptional regulator PadR